MLEQEESTKKRAMDDPLLTSAARTTMEIYRMYHRDTDTPQLTAAVLTQTTVLSAMLARLNEKGLRKKGVQTRE